MPRRRPRRPPPLDERDLAAEVLYLHSLWRRGPPAPAPAPVPATASTVPNQPEVLYRHSLGRRGPPATVLVTATASTNPNESEVLYLHSLWRRGPSAPPPVPATASVVANQPRTAPVRRRAVKRKRRWRGGGAAKPEDAGPERRLASSPPASASTSSTPEEATPPSPAHPAAQEENAISGRDPGPSSSARKRMCRGLEHDATERSQDAGSEWPPAPSPPTAHNAWPDVPNSSRPIKPPPPPSSPGSLAQWEALRAAEEFFANQGSDDDEDDEEESETEGNEEDAAGFITGLFESNAALRGHYERGWEEGQFACIACAGRKARKGKVRRFRGCVGLVQHARAATRYRRLAAHRALAAVVCRVLGWDIERLPSIVIDPRGTLGQALAARALSPAGEPKEDVETQVEALNTNGDQVADERVTSNESAGMMDIEKTGPLNCEDGLKNNGSDHETNQKEDAIKTGTKEAPSTDDEKETIEVNNGGKESPEKEDAVKAGMKESPSTDSEKEAIKLTNGGKESSEKEDAVVAGMKEPTSTVIQKEAIELNNGGKESSQKDNAIKDDSLSQDNNGACLAHDISIKCTEKDQTDTCSKDTCNNERHCIKACVQEVGNDSSSTFLKVMEVNATVSEPGHAMTEDNIERHC